MTMLASSTIIRVTWRSWRRYARWQPDRGVQPAQVALAWLLSKPAVTAPIIGATKLEHLQAAVAAVDLQLSEEEIRRLEAPYQPHAVRGFN